MAPNILDFLEKIPGFGLFAIAVKEINLIKTQKIALALILLYPIVVIATLGAAFSGNIGITSADAAFYAPSGLTGFDTNAFLEKLRQTNNVNLLMQQSESGVYNAVKNRQAKIGIIVHHPEPTTGRFVVDIVTDNSSLFSSEFFFQVANTAIRRVGFDTSKELLSDIWENLTTIKGSIGTQTIQIDGFIRQLDESEAKVLSLKQSINEINITEMRQKLEEQRMEIDAIKPKIADFSGSITAFREINRQNLANLSDAQEELKEYREKVSSMRAQIEPVKAELEAHRGEIEKQPVLFAAYSQLIETDTSLASAENQIGQAITKLKGAETQLIGADGALENASVTIAEINGNFRSANKDLDYFNAQLSTLGETVDKLNALADESMEAKQKARADLESSKTVMMGFVEKLDQLQALSPDFLSNPVIINKVKVYEASNLEIITPMAVVLLLLLTTILLTSVSFVTERTEGAYSRLLLSQTGKVSIFAGKVLGQLIFALVESAIILLIAIIAFGTKITVPLPELAAAISVVSVSFIALGLFISNYTKIQSTTILAGLIFVLPMMFLSGLIIPVELMSPQIQQIGAATPLSIGIRVLTETLVKGTPIAQQAIEIAKLLGSSIVFFVFTLLNRNL